MKAESPISEMYLGVFGSGGVITNYHYTARCAHCLYNCSPERERSYLSNQLRGYLTETGNEIEELQPLGYYG